MLDGRVKTLHPKVHGGILARRDVAGASRRARASTTSRRSTSSSSTSIRSARRSRSRAARSRTRSRTSTSAVPPMVRAAAKNWPHVGVVVDPATTRGCSASSRRTAARCPTRRVSPSRSKAFAHTAVLRRRDRELADRARARRSRAAAFPTSFTLCRRAQGAGRCATARTRTSRRRSTATSRRRRARIATFRQLQGKELSYNNIADSDAAWECVKTFAEPGVRDRQARESLRRRDRRDAARGVPQGVRDRSRRRRSAASSRSTGRSTPRRVEAVAAQFVEVLIAPGYTDDALAVIDAEEERARAGDSDAGDRRGGDRARLEARRRRPARADAPTAQSSDAPSLKVVTRRRRRRSRCATCCSPGASRSS